MSGNPNLIFDYLTKKCGVAFLKAYKNSAPFKIKQNKTTQLNRFCCFSSVYKNF